MASLKGKRALLLGSGFVATPTVDVLVKSGVHVTVACRTLAAAETMASRFANSGLTSAVSLDVSDASALEAAVAAHDVVISLIPYTYHATVIKAAIKAKKHVVTTSYVSPAMKELDAAAKEAGIVVMNEIGLDPGIDHLYAVKTIREVHQAGGKIDGFWSYCGGLPAPECSDNPLGYKFSWSSRGVLLALKNEAKFYADGKEEFVSSEDLMATAKPWDTGYMGYAFVAYPNRDSTPYRERYSIPEARTIIRGTLRYACFPSFVKTLVDMSYLSDAPHPLLQSADAKNLTWSALTAALLGVASTSDESSLVKAIDSKTTFADAQARETIYSGIRWLGLLTDAKLGDHARATPLDTLCAALEQRCQFAPGERDLVFLQHRFAIIHKDGSKETRTSTLVENGDPKGYSAMAKLVGVPCGVATCMVLDGRINQKGIQAPMEWEIVQPLMDELKKNYAIELMERTV